MPSCSFLLASQASLLDFGDVVVLVGVLYLPITVFSFSFVLKNGTNQIVDNPHFQDIAGYKRNFPPR